jgi:hypothetical protein
MMLMSLMMLLFAINGPVTAIEDVVEVVSLDVAVAAIGVVFDVKSIFCWVKLRDCCHKLILDQTMRIVNKSLLFL